MNGAGPSMSKIWLASSPTTIGASGLNHSRPFTLWLMND
jgi:hypothetical protein